MVIFYNLGIYLYYYFLVIASVFNSKANLWVKGRANQKVIPLKDRKSIWFHCASLGEFEQAKPLVKSLKKEYPNYQLVVTFFSPSGFEVVKNNELIDYVYYLHLDTKYNAKVFIENINPTAVIFIKYEFWHHYLNELKIQKIPTFLVAAIFRKDQVFFSWYGGFFRKMLNNFSLCFVQNADSEKLLQSIGFQHVEVINDTRFDTVISTFNSVEKYDLVEQFIGDKKCLVIGSSWLKDEQLFKSIQQSFYEEFKVVIAPHEINNNRLSEVENIFENAIRYSELLNGSSVQEKNCLIIDNFGMLTSLYQYADVAYIGGGFGVSVHNVLEAAVFGNPLLFGPNHKKSQEALDLKELTAATVVLNSADLNNRLQHFSVEKNRVVAGTIAKEYVFANSGGTSKVLSKIKSLKIL